MSREIRRVPVDFDWPLGKVWHGYLMPKSLDLPGCLTCAGDGYSPRARHLHATWYGNVPFRPEDNGSTPFTAETPAVRERAERNVEQAPEFYEALTKVRRPGAIRREAERLAAHFNNGWLHHLNADDVAALVTAGRLMDFTHTFDRVNRWQPKNPPVMPTPTEVNEWSLSGFGHDSINCWVAVRARCEREGAAYECAICGGSGNSATEDQKAAHEAWDPTEPPEGEGWQLWETVSEGSPVTPVFATSEALVEHLITVGGRSDRVEPWSREAAEAMVASGWAPSLVSLGDGKVYANAEALVALNKAEGVRVVPRLRAEPDRPHYHTWIYHQAPDASRAPMVPVCHCGAVDFDHIAVWAEDRIKTATCLADADTADLRAEAERLAEEIERVRGVLAAMLPVVQYVSAGRGYVGVEPYPDATARRALGMAWDAGLLDAEGNLRG